MYYPYQMYKPLLTLFKYVAVLLSKYIMYAVVSDFLLVLDQHIVLHQAVCP